MSNLKNLQDLQRFQSIKSINSTNQAQSIRKYSKEVPNSREFIDSFCRMGQLRF